MKPIFTFLCWVAGTYVIAQKVGINTNQPKAMLHVKDSTVLFEGPKTLDLIYSGPVPVTGEGARMLWFAPKAAFRTGYVSSDVPDAWNTQNMGYLSFATGRSTKAKGDFSFAMGSHTLASGNYSLAGGFLSVASGMESFAIGNYDSASGDNSFAFGENSKASGRSSMAVGYNSQSLQLTSFALGNSVVASGVSSFATGFNSKSSGLESFASGEESEASGEVSAAFNSSEASGPFSFSANTYTNASGRNGAAFGHYTVARSKTSFVVGEYNDTSNMTNKESSVLTDAIFQVGNGAYAARHNALSVLRNGNVGIGINNPTALLHLKSNSTIAVPQVFLEEEGSDFARLGFKNGNTSNAWHIAASPSTTNSTSYMNFFWQGSGANVLILKGDGNAILQGTLTQNSDERLKTNISKLNDPLSMIDQLNGYHYQWKDASRDQSLQTGLLAQEVEKLMPELVKKDENGIKSVNYAGLIPYLLESIKSLKAEVDQLKKQ